MSGDSKGTILFHANLNDIFRIIRKVSNLLVYLLHAQTLYMIVHYSILHVAFFIF